MKVIIRLIKSKKTTVGGAVVHEFDSSRGNTGHIIEIEKSTPRAHDAKIYRVELDPPNWGVIEFLGTTEIEKF